MGGPKAFTASTSQTGRIAELDRIGNDETKSRKERGEALLEADARVKMLREIREDLGLEVRPGA